jgi:hypothetical protein
MDSEMQGGKNWILPKEINATGSSRASLAGNLEKPLMSLYGTEWRERGYVQMKLLHVQYLHFKPVSNHFCEEGATSSCNVL